MDARTATSADGFVYENTVYVKGNKILKKRGKVMLPGDSLTLPLLEHFFGKVDPSAIAAERVAFAEEMAKVKAARDAKDARGNSGANDAALRASPHMGMDFVVVGEGVLEGTEPLGEEREIGEAKLGHTIDQHVLGPTIGLVHRTFRKTGRLLKTWLFSPQPPTPEVYKTLDANDEGTKYFEHVKIAGEKTGPLRQTEGADEAPVVATTVRPRGWQRVAARKAVVKWNNKGERIVTLTAPMGMGKTIAGWETLTKATGWPVRLFVCHTIAMAQQVAGEAKKIGIRKVHDLTSHGRELVFDLEDEAAQGVEDQATSAKRAKGAASPTYSTDSTESTDSTKAESAKACEQLQAKLRQLVSSAQAKNRPVYAVITHKMMRSMADVGFAAFDTKMAMVVDEFHLLKKAVKVFNALLDPKAEVRTMCVSATPPKLLGRSLKEEDGKASGKKRKNKDNGGGAAAEATALAAARAVGELLATKASRVPGKTLHEGIEHGCLVPLLIESVLTVDEETRELVDPKKTMTLEQRCKAIADWMVARNHYTLSVFCTSTKVADEAAKLVKAEIEALVSGAKVFSESYHSNKTQSECDRILSDFRKEYSAHSNKLIFSVGKLREGFDMPHLQAVAFLDNPKDVVGIFQGVGRCMRAYKNKAWGHALVFGEETAAAVTSIMRIGDVRNVEHVRLGVTTADFDTMMAAAEPHSETAKRVRAAAKAAHERLRKAVETKNHSFALLISSAEKRMKAKVAAFVAQFESKAPVRSDGQMLHYVVNGVALADQAGYWLKGVRQSWFVVTQEQFRTTSEQKTELCALKWFEAPEPPKPKVKLPTGVTDEEIMDARITAYAAAFAETAPKRDDSQMLGGTLRGVALQPIQAFLWKDGVLKSFFGAHRKFYATTDAQKSRLLALPSFKIKTESAHVTHMRNAVETLVATGKWPTKASGQTGEWLVNWKTKGLRHKDAVDAVVAEVLATVADAAERAKLQQAYDDLVNKVSVHVTHVRNAMKTLVATGRWPPRDSGPTGTGLHNWKSTGLSDKDACDAAAAEVLATVADDERAKFQAKYDKFTQLTTDVQKRAREEVLAKEATAAAKKARIV